MFESTEVIEDIADDEVIVSTEPEESPDFQEGFASVVGGESEPEAQPEPQPQQEFIGGLSKADFDAIVEKANKVDELNERLRQVSDKAFGSIGNITQQLNFLKQAQAQPKADISKDAFKALTEYYGDDSLAEALANDLRDIGLIQTAAQPGFTQDDFEAALQAKTENLERTMNMKLLAMRHPDWEDTKDTPEFQGWAATLPESDQELLYNTWDAVVLSKAFDGFKSWSTKKSQVEAKKKARLEGAILPTGGRSGAEASEEDYFNQGINKVLKNR